MDPVEKLIWIGLAFVLANIVLIVAMVATFAQEA